MASVTSPIKKVQESWYVIKRDGTKTDVKFDKITERLQTLCAIEPRLSIEPVTVTSKVIAGFYNGVSTAELDNLAAEIAAYMSTDNLEFGELAARIAISNLQKQTSSSFSETMQKERDYVNPKTGQAAPLIAEDVNAIIQKNAEKLNSAVKYERDYLFDFFGFKTLERSYLNRLNNVIVERPQHMLMRVSVGIHKGDIDAAIETYNLMSQKYFTHATPTLFNAGTPTPQMSSCFLMTMKEDSIEGIYDTLKRCALISKSAGGIGLSVHNIRAAHSYIRGTNGTSNGLVPMLKVFNDTARYVDQGGGKRKGAFAVYLEPWHADIFEFLDLRKNTGKDEQRCRDLFFSLWVSDLFMKRVEANEDWSLFCPNEAPGLSDTWGEEFERLYESYEKKGIARKKVRAQELWYAIVESQIETGTPYMMYKDSCNRKSNQQNLGTIKSSNLCTEIVEYTSPDEIAVCNLASIALPKFVNNGKFDHQKLFEITKVITKNLNKIIDGNFYPVEEARKSNMRHRPIGLGVQGLADVFIKLRMAFDSEAAAKLNKEIFETIYFAALTASKDIAKIDGPYATYAGSPVSKGILQYDMWDVTPSDRWDWTALKADIAQHGVRNSLLVAPMPTASTSQILGNNECFEPYTSNMYTRRVLAGEFAIVNKQLIEDLGEMGLWSPDMKNKIIANNGSIQKINEIPQELKELYKTVWEISMRTLINMAADRGAFVDQSQSFNVFIAEPTFQKLTSMHFYAWKKGLKTGMYYLRTRPAVDAIKFTVDQTALNKEQAQPQAKTVEPSAAQSPVKQSPMKQQAQQQVPSSPSAEDGVGALYCTKEEGCFVCGS
eukprot:TRINITY_DN1276_c0_g1_i1.p1 TRINITY_DN1276_c0_g1~~TRINITY_DN1276_c0_g1_i1.p1  ORF type:complete len:831 (-),score=305.79 TRINITY_DN1276_c0_g1_i1:75-2567(-)